MSDHFQVSLPDVLGSKVREAALRSRISEEEWVRRAIERSLDPAVRRAPRSSALARLEALDAPTCDIERMLAEIEAGRQ